MRDLFGIGEITQLASVDIDNGWTTQAAALCDGRARRLDE